MKYIFHVKINVVNFRGLTIFLWVQLFDGRYVYRWNIFTILPTKHTYSLNKKLKNVFLKNEVKSYKNAKDLFLIRQKTHDILQPYNMHYITEHSVIFEVIKAL